MKLPVLVISYSPVKEASNLENTPRGKVDQPLPALSLPNLLRMIRVHRDDLELAVISLYPGLRT